MIQDVYGSAGATSALEAKADVYLEAIKAQDRFVRLEKLRWDLSRLPGITDFLEVTE